MKRFLKAALTLSLACCMAPGAALASAGEYEAAVALDQSAALATQVAKTQAAKAKAGSKWIVKTKDYRFTIPKYWRGKVQWKTTKSPWQGASGKWHNSYRTIVYLKGHKGDDRYRLVGVFSGGLTGVNTGFDVLVYRRAKRQDNQYVNEDVSAISANWPYFIWLNAHSKYSSEALDIPVKAQKKLLKLSTGNKVSYKAAKKSADYNTKNYKAVAKYLKPKFKKSLKVLV